MNNSFFDLLLKTIGIVLAIGLVLLAINSWGRWVREEIMYKWEKLVGVEYSSDYENPFPPAGVRVLRPKSGFGIVIARLGISSQIIKTTLGQSPGVLGENNFAFVQGSSFPDEGGTVFLLAHSPQAFFQKTNQNPKLFLLRYLQEGDEILIFFGNKKYFYKIVQKDIVNSFPSSWPKDSNSLYIVCAEPLSNSWLTILAKSGY